MPRVRAACELRRAEAPGNRVYLYAPHRSWVGGRRRIVKHYLGSRRGSGSSRHLSQRFGAKWAQWNGGALPAALM